jgi:nucleoside-diphosphate-sugar epimerase
MVPILQEMGHEVIGLDSDLYRECTYYQGIQDIPLIFKDIRDVEVRDLADLDAIIHLAALSNDPLGNFNPSITEEINHRASVRLARLSKESGVSRFLFSSTCSVYGASDDTILTEESATRPVTPYASSKLLAERDIARLADDSFTPVFLRSATAYGVSPRLRFDLVLNNLVAWAFTTGKVMLKSDGTSWRPVVHIRDISKSFAQVLVADGESVHGEVFNVGGENYQIRDLALIAKEVVPGSEVEFAPDASTDKRCYRVRCKKLAETLPGFSTEWTARKGAEELHGAYREHGLTLREFEGPRFKRIDHLRMLMDRGTLDQSFRRSEV